MKKRRLLCLVLALAVIASMLGVGSALAISPVKLHTGGGVIVSSDWTVSADDDYTYEGRTTVLPTPQMAGATFEGWYTDIALSTGRQDAGATVDGGEYYAKWTPIQSAKNANMEYTLTSSGGTANGFKNGDTLKAFYANLGFFTAYSTSSLPAAGGTVAYSGTTVITLNNAYTQLTGDTYLMRTMNLEGGLVRLTYYVTNRGSSAVSGLSLGAAGDSQLGGNDFVPLSVVTENGDTYLKMYDAAAGNELRLYYKGDKVTDTDRFWYGGYWQHSNKNDNNFLGNTFNDGKDAGYTDGIDSAFAFSWENIELTAGETKKFSVLLGVGAPGTLEGGCSLIYDVSGGEWADGEPTTRSYASGDVAAVSEFEPERAGYTFLGWGFSPADKGTPYQHGTDNNKVAVVGDTVLYALWTPTPYAATVTLNQDGSALSGQAVTLVKDGLIRYELTYDSEAGAYINKPVTIEEITTGGVISGDYDVYINGADSGSDFTIENAPNAVTLNYRSANVNLTKDDAAWTGQTVALYQDNTKLFTLEYNDESAAYELGFIPADSYDIFLNGTDTGVDMDISEVGAAKVTSELAYYTATVDLKLDDAPWTAQTVTIGTQRAQYMDNAYTAVALGEQMVMRGGDALGGVSASGKTISADYYTVTFHNNASETKQIVKSGEEAESFTLPPENNAVHIGWAYAVGGEAVTFPFTVTAAKDFYALWNNPVVLPGEASKLSNTTYKCPELTITGYGDKLISSMKIEITSGGGSVSLTSADARYTIVQNSATSITVLCTTPVSASEAAALLRTAVFTLGTQTQNVTFTAFAN